MKTLIKTVGISLVLAMCGGCSDDNAPGAIQPGTFVDAGDADMGGWSDTTQDGTDNQDVGVDSTVGDSTIDGADTGPDPTDSGSDGVFDVSDANPDAFDAQDVNDEPEVPDPLPPIRFAIIGDYGVDNGNEAATAALINSWDPEFIVTVGDNNLPNGAAGTIDENIGKYFHDYIYPYTGSYGAGSPDGNRFWPTLGNHDWMTDDSPTAYTDYFELPNNERYYDMVIGPVHFFMIDSDNDEPDGRSWGSTQADWFETRMAASTAPFQFAFFHHPPFSSGYHGSSSSMQWPWETLGIDATITGHEHTYERLTVNGVPHINAGMGGQSLRSHSTHLSSTRVQYEGEFSAVLVDVDEHFAMFSAIDVDGGLFDRVVLRPDGGFARPGEWLVTAGSTWSYLDDGSDQGTAWREAAFSESWATGPAPLGYGDGDEATVVSFGTDSGNKHITTYFRHQFEVVEPDAYGLLELGVRRDDGAIAYLNGTEVFRTNMPDGTVNYLTVAAGGTSDESSFFGTEVDPGLLVTGTNLLAIEVHQRSGSSSDIKLDAELLATTDDNVLIPFGAQWHYLDEGELPPDNWSGLGFVDDSWAEGPAPLGYGNGNEATTVDNGGNPSDVRVTTWFRHTFSVTDTSGFDNLLLCLVRDDGAVVYLNGTEVHRINLPVDTVSSSTYAHTTIGGFQESQYHETIVDPALLVEGDNVIAVEVHQASAGSSDLRLDLELSML